MLEQSIQALVAAVEKNTAALIAANGGKAPAAAATAKPPKSAPAEPETPKVTFDEVKLACNKVAKELGVPKAQKMILDVGGAAQLAGVKPAKYAALLAAAQAALTPPDDEPGDEDTEL